MKVDVYDIKRKKVGEAEISDTLFGEKWNADLVHQAVETYLSNQRNPIAHVKSRGEVKGGGRKPWRQKGTGRARHGSRRSPIWIGGGVTFGPRNERDFSKKLNKKMGRKALSSVLSKKLKDGEIFVVENLNVEGKKTKRIEAFIKSFFEKKPSSILIIPAVHAEEVFVSSRNIPGISSITPDSLNAYDCISRKNLVFEKGAIEGLK